MDQFRILCLTLLFSGIFILEIVSYRSEAAAVGLGGSRIAFPSSGSNAAGGASASSVSGTGASAAGGDCTWIPIPALSKSSGGGGGGIAGQLQQRLNELSLDCHVRKLSVDFWNYTFSSQQLTSTTSLRLKCNPSLFFESVLNSSSQNVFQLIALKSIQIESCKLRRLPSGIFSSFTSLRNLTVHSFNGEWIGGNYGLELESGAFEGAKSVEKLDLSFNNIWSISDKIFCPLSASLVSLNLSHNRLSEVWDDNNGNFKFLTSETPQTSSSSSSSPSAALNINHLSGNNDNSNNNNCQLSLLKLDLSFNIIRRIGRTTFSRMRKLTTLTLDNNYIDEMEDNALANSCSILKTLNLSSNRLVALPPSLLKSCLALEEIYLQNNSLSVLSPTIFTGLQLRAVDLSKNSLSSQWVKETIFAGLSQLRVLKLSHNQLSYIASNLFHGLTSLQSLHLDNNRIESIDPKAFSSLAGLRLLDMSRNQLKFIESKLFSNGFVLTQLYLDYNRITSIDHESFTNVSQLSDLGLAGNLLTKVPLAFQDGLGTLKTLDIGENKIGYLNQDSFKGLGQLYGLRLAGNVLNLLPPGLCTPLSSLRVLNLAQNQLRTISPSSFSGCSELRALRLDANQLDELPTFLPPQLLWLNVSENRIKMADYHTLPKTIEWLDLSYNSLLFLGNGKIGATSSSSGEVSSSASSSSSSSSDVNEPHLHHDFDDEHEKEYHLRVLDASHNNLTHLDYSTVPLSLETLRLNHNRLKSVAPNTFARANRLRRVELMGNKLQDLPMSALRLPPSFASSQQKVQLPDFYIGGGSILTCSCSMEWLSRINQLSNLNKQLPRIVDSESVFCRPAFSRTNEVIPLIEAKPSHFLCPYKSVCFALCHCCGFNCDCENQCPDSCSCFHDASWTTNIVECSNLNMSSIPERIPMDATELYLDGNSLTSELNSHMFIGKKNLKILHLNGSRIETIRNKTFNGLKAMEILRLDHNSLTALQGFEFDDLENLRELYLQHNLLNFIAADTFSRLRRLEILRIDGNLLIDFNIWELQSNFYLSSVSLASNPWTCDCEFILQVNSFVNLKSNIFGDYHLAKCQIKVNNNANLKYNDHDGDNNDDQEEVEDERVAQQQLQQISSQRIRPISTAVSLSSICNTIESTYHNFNVNEDGRISRIGDPMLIYPSANVLSTQNGNNHNKLLTRAGEKSENSSSGPFWTWFLSLSALFLLILTISLIFRQKIYYWCLRHLLLNESSFLFCGCCFCCTKGQGNNCPLREKVGCSSSSKLGHETNGRSGGGEDNEKLFDAYFLYSKKDEEMLCQKLTPQLEQQQQQQQTPHNENFRLCLHYRDLCLNLENPWSTEMILTACDASKRIAIILSRTFLHSELTNPEFRSCLQHVLSKFPKKIIFILLPPLNEHNFPQLYPDFKSSTFRHSTLDWMDKHFWTKLKTLLPAPSLHAPTTSSTSSENSNSLIFNRSPRNGSLNKNNRSRFQSPGNNNINLALQEQDHEFPYNHLIQQFQNHQNPSPLSFQQHAQHPIMLESPSSEYYRNILPYQIPNSAATLGHHHHVHHNQGSRISNNSNNARNSLRNNNNVPKQHIALSTPLFWSSQPPPPPPASINAIYPTQPQPSPQYFTFADNFRHHRQLSQEQQQQQQQPQHPFVFANSPSVKSPAKDKRQNRTSSQNKKSSSSASSCSPYKPLIIRNSSSSADQSSKINHNDEGNISSSSMTNILQANNSNSSSCSSNSNSSHSSSNSSGGGGDGSLLLLANHDNKHDQINNISPENNQLLLYPTEHIYSTLDSPGSQHHLHPHHHEQPSPTTLQLMANFQNNIVCRGERGGGDGENDLNGQNPGNRTMYFV